MRRGGLGDARHATSDVAAWATRDGQHATCDMRHAICDMRRATCDVRATIDASTYEEPDNESDVLLEYNHHTNS